MVFKKKHTPVDKPHEKPAPGHQSNHHITFESRASPLKAGIAAGLVSGLFLLVLGLLASADIGGAIVRMLGTAYLGYSAGIPGSLVGFLWGFVDGFVFAYLAVWIYNILALCKHF